MSQPLDSAPGTELFASYESDFQLTYSEIVQKLQELNNLGPDHRKSGTQAIERTIDEAYEILDQLTVEVQNIASAQRGKFNSKLREYRSNVDKSKRELVRRKGLPGLL
jgi:vesicle transport through interaction with t-SNAREs protein 1